MNEPMQLTVTTAEAESIWGSSAIRSEDPSIVVIHLTVENADTDRDSSGYAGA